MSDKIKVRKFDENSPNLYCRVADAVMMTYDMDDKMVFCICSSKEKANICGRDNKHCGLVDHMQESLFPETFDESEKTGMTVIRTPLEERPEVESRSVAIPWNKQMEATSDKDKK